MGEGGLFGPSRCYFVFILYQHNFGYFFLRRGRKNWVQPCILGNLKRIWKKGQAFHWSFDGVRAWGPSTLEFINYQVSVHITAL